MWIPLGLTVHWFWESGPRVPQRRQSKQEQVRGAASSPEPGWLLSCQAMSTAAAAAEVLAGAGRVPAVVVKHPLRHLCRCQGWPHVSLVGFSNAGDETAPFRKTSEGYDECWCTYSSLLSVIISYFGAGSQAWDSVASEQCSLSTAAYLLRDIVWT